MEAGVWKPLLITLPSSSEAYLIAALPKFSALELRRRTSPPKLIALSNAFLAAIDAVDPPSAATDPSRWGRWLENACIAQAVNAGYQVNYWREESRVVDMIINGDEGKWDEAKAVLSPIMT